MTKKEALFRDLEQARNEVNQLLAKYHELKDSQEYADLISAAADSDNMETAMKAVQEWDEAHQFTATHDALAAAQERLTKANHAYDDYCEQQERAHRCLPFEKEQDQQNECPQGKQNAVSPYLCVLHPSCFLTAFFISLHPAAVRSAEFLL